MVSPTFEFWLTGTVSPFSRTALYLGEISSCTPTGGTLNLFTMTCFSSVTTLGTSSQEFKRINARIILIFFKCFRVFKIGFTVKEHEVVFKLIIS